MNVYYQDNFFETKQLTVNTRLISKTDGTFIMTTYNLILKYFKNYFLNKM